MPVAEFGKLVQLMKVGRNSKNMYSAILWPTYLKSFVEYSVKILVQNSPDPVNAYEWIYYLKSKQRSIFQKYFCNIDYNCELRVEKLIVLWNTYTAVIRNGLKVISNTPIVLTFKKWSLKIIAVITLNIHVFQQRIKYIHLTRIMRITLN